MSCILLSITAYLPELFSCVIVISSRSWGRQYVNYILKKTFFLLDTHTIAINNKEKTLKQY